MNKPFHMIAKPTSFQCNLVCEYCFYLDKGQDTLKSANNSRHMDDETLHRYIQQYIQSHPSQEVEFIWQGGEPTLAGIPFYEKALHWQRKYAGDKTILNSFQTNGVLINDEWGKFLSENKFLVGISIDGPEEIHNCYRVNHGGKSVFSKVMNAVDIFKKYNIAFNVLTVVNNVNCHAPLEVYRFITRDVGAKFVQFIPAVEQYQSELPQTKLIYPQSEHRKQLTAWSVSGENWGKFINTIFDYWVKNDVGEKFVQLFDNTLAAWIGEKPGLCVMNATCGRGLVIEKNGDIYDCDHYVYPSHKLGNINKDDLSKIVYGKKHRKFGLSKSNVSKMCQQCDWLFACQGGCPKHRINQVENRWHNHLCAGYKAIFSHTAPYMQFMAQQLARNAPPSKVIDIAPLD